MLRPWLAHYPAEVPAEIPPHDYASLTDLLDRACRRHAGRTVCRFMGSDISYAELDAKAAAFAGWLQARGLRRGERVALMMPNVPAYFVALLGVLRAGLAVVNVNPLYTANELGHQLRDCGAGAIVILESFAHVLQRTENIPDLRHVVVVAPGDMLGAFKAPLVNFIAKRVKKRVPAWRIEGAHRWAGVMRSRKPYAPVPVQADDLAVLQYTGGTTGLPKGAMLTHGNLVANVLQVAAVARPALGDLGGPPQTILGALPLYHVFAMTVCGLFCMHAGMRNLLIINPRDRTALIHAWRKTPVHLFPGVNTLFNGLLSHTQFASLDFSALRMTFAGGMAVQASVAEHWSRVTGGALIEGYGLSETSPVATVNPTNSTSYSGTAGLPLPSTDVAILDEAGAALPIGEVGEVGIRGPQVMKGYWRQPEETWAVMTPDGFFRTGDIGVLDERGCLSLVDRKKDMITVAGFKVYPNEVEALVATHPGVLECAVVGVPSRHSGESVRLYVVRRDPALTQGQLMAWCRQRLVGYKRPRRVIFRDELPKTNVGKILRRALREA
ncbi:MAG TPA: AMP-binding protein [Bordetella sp.]